MPLQSLLIFTILLILNPLSSPLQLTLLVQLFWLFDVLSSSYLPRASFRLSVLMYQPLFHSFSTLPYPYYLPLPFLPSEPQIHRPSAG